MDWHALEGLLRCQADSDLLRGAILVLAACASIAAIIGAFYRLLRWLIGPSGRHRRAARALREQAKVLTSLKDPQQAMELYDLAVRFNPGAAQVYFLRGCLKEELDQINRAIADWKRCLHRLPKHAGATQKLAQYGITGVRSGWPSWAIATGAVAGVVVIFALAGAFSG